MESISASVGLGGVNWKTDVRKVQRLLNRFRPHGEMLLKADGLAGHRTSVAIQHFQHVRVASIHPDGRVDAAGPTLKALSEHPGLHGPVHPSHMTPPAHSRPGQPSRVEKPSVPWSATPLVPGLWG